jgi:hypothetical protein
MEFRIITPFSRPHNIPALVENLPRAGVNRWIPIPHELVAFPALDWLQPLPSPVQPAGWDLCYWKLNYAIDRIEYDPAVYYGFLCDDDTIDGGAIDQIRFDGSEVLVISARRYAEGKHCGSLIAAPENARVCHVGVEQIFIRGDVLSHYRFENACTADGQLVERLAAERQVKYFPEVFCNWNILPR